MNNANTFITFLLGFDVFLIGSFMNTLHWYLSAFKNKDKNSYQSLKEN